MADDNACGVVKDPGQQLKTGWGQSDIDTNEYIHNKQHRKLMMKFAMGKWYASIITSDSSTFGQIDNPLQAHAFESERKHAHWNS